MDKVLIFDLQTKLSYDDVGGKIGINKMGVAAAGLYDCLTNKFRLYHEDNIQTLIQDLFSSTLVFGSNLKRFSYKVLSGFSNNDFSTLKTIDLLDYFKKKLSFKPSTEGLCLGTLGKKKAIITDIFVPRLYKQGKIDEINALCEKNVLDLKEFYDFGKERGFVFFTDDSGQRWKISVDW